MKAGISETVITPPVGGWLLGPLAPSTGVHDDLYARALVLDDGRQRVAILCLDLIGLTLTFSDELRDAIRRQTGIETALINCSHTHSAPFSVPWSVEGWKRHCEQEGAWREQLRTALPKLVRDAAGKLVPASLRVGRAAVQVGVNRRVLTEDGVVMLPNPDGPVVPWVDVLQVNDGDGRPLAVLFSHAAHPVIVHASSKLISADYPGAAVARIRKELGPQVLPLFAQGCCGNVNGAPLRSGHSMAEAAGKKLADAVLRATRESASVAASKFEIACRTLSLPRQARPSEEACARAISEVESKLAMLESNAPQYRDRVRALRRKMFGTDEEAPENKGELPWMLRDQLLCLRDLQRRLADQSIAVLRFEATALMLGTEWCLLAMTHELFCEYALWADEVSPFESTMIWAYTNGAESYVPTDRAFEEGGYEAASFPLPGAALAYGGRLALRPGVERQIKEMVQSIWANVRTPRRNS